MEKGPKQGTRVFTVSDFRTWPDDERWELIDGVPFAMAPAPGSLHQEISMELARQFANFLKGKPCKVYAAPFDVVLPGPKEAEQTSTTVVQPDLSVVCDAEKRTDRGCLGPPDLVVEILSPGSMSHDQVRKLNLYERVGVREYWILHPDGTLMVFKLGPKGRYGRPDTYASQAHVHVGLFPDLVIDLGEVFPPRPTVVRESPAPYRPSD